MTISVTMMLNNAAKHPATVILGLFLVIGAGLATGQTSMVSHAHDGVSCSSCHTGGQPVVDKASIQAGCTSCHDAPHGTGAMIAGFMARPQQSCLDCHRFHRPEVLQAAGAEMTLPASGLDSAHCKACHHPEGSLKTLSDAHRTAATFYHLEGAELDKVSPSDVCLKCHSADSESAWKAATAPEELAFNEHAGHPYGVVVIPGAGNSTNYISHRPDPRLPLNGNRIECNTCHLLTAATDDLLFKYDNKYDLCLGCHEHDDGSGPSRVEVRVTQLGLSK